MLFLIYGRKGAKYLLSGVADITYLHYSDQEYEKDPMSGWFGAIEFLVDFLSMEHETVCCIINNKDDDEEEKEHTFTKMAEEQCDKKFVGIRSRKAIS